MAKCGAPSIKLMKHQHKKCKNHLRLLFFMSTSAHELLYRETSISVISECTYTVYNIVANQQSDAHFFVTY